MITESEKADRKILAWELKRRYFPLANLDKTFEVWDEALINPPLILETLRKGIRNLYSPIEQILETITKLEFEELLKETSDEKTILEFFQMIDRAIACENAPSSFHWDEDGDNWWKH